MANSLLLNYNIFYEIFESLCIKINSQYLLTKFSVGGGEYAFMREVKGS